MYYNPWDAQYITYMKVSYDEEAYEAEMARLQSIGQGAYQGMYSVTGEPLGYDLVAIYPDEYLLKGFDATIDNPYRKSQMGK